MPYMNYPFRFPKSQVVLALVSLFLIFAFIFPHSAFADDPCKNINDLDDKAECYGEQKDKKEEEYESISKKLSNLREEKDEISGKISNLSNELSVTEGELNSIQASINQVANELRIIEGALINRQLTLSEKIVLRNRAVRTYYQSGVLNDLETFLRTSPESNLNGFQYSAMRYMFEKTLSSEARKLISLLNSEITNFENDKIEAQSIKEELEVVQENLVALKIQLDNQKLQAEQEFGELETKEGDYKSSLESLEKEIDELSSKQQDILKQKFGDINGTVGNFESPNWTVPDPPFEPAFAAFSYGAYTHYNGMSQYGAKGRAEDGKDYKDILEYYYDTDVKEKDDFPDKIEVQGYGKIDFQYYLYGIAEMPSDWPMDALKAQAIAARTYAYRSNKPICTTQSCQVFLKSKADNPPDRWKEAVDETKDKILDDPFTSQYSSTTGGYLNQSGWDTDGGSWPKDAYEKKAGSPWFYWAWYSQNYRFDSNTCGRSHPWLNEKEMADILNAIVVWDRGNGDDKDRISPVTTSCWGGDPYSNSEMANRAEELGKKYDEVRGVDVDVGNNGRTVKVTFETDNGDISVDGEKFKTVFNLRAPGYLAIKSRLYDIEMER